jgi:hypothetical protein
MVSLVIPCYNEAAALALSSITLLYLIYGLTMHLVYGAILVPGWSRLILVTVLFGTSNLICLGILGEYVGRIFEQVKERPLYAHRMTTQ